MTALLYLLAGLGVLALLCTLFFGILCWIGKGSPDANGDPERDSGRPINGIAHVCSYCKCAMDSQQHRVRTSHGLCVECAPGVERAEGLAPGTLTGLRPGLGA